MGVAIRCVLTPIVNTTSVRIMLANMVSQNYLELKKLNKLRTINKVVRTFELIF